MGHGNMSAASLFGCSTTRKTVANKSPGNKRHNTRMLSRKLVLIFKALHYLRPERDSGMQSKKKEREGMWWMKRDGNSVKSPKSWGLNQVKLNQLFRSPEKSVN